MFSKIDSKIKAIAVLDFVLGLLAAIAGLIVMLAADSSTSVIIGAVLLVYGIISILASWVLYGFGVLVEKVCNISDCVTRTAQNKGVTDSQSTEFKPKQQRGYFANELNPFEGSTAMKIPKRSDGENKDDN